MLEDLPSLETLRVSGYSKIETERFYRVTELADSFAPSPDVRGWT